MSSSSYLSLAQFASLKEVAKGFNQGAVPTLDAGRLLELGLIYKLLGDLRLTTSGRVRIADQS
jgi:hypothetical protein